MHSPAAGTRSKSRLEGSAAVEQVDLCTPPEKQRPAADAKPEDTPHTEKQQQSRLAQVAALSDEQRGALELVLSGESVFITGNAG